MQWTTVAVVVGLVVASLAGASVPVAAQSGEETVTLTVEVVVPSSNQRLGGVDLVASWDGDRTTVTTASNGRAFIDVPLGATVEITLDDDEYMRNEPYRIRVATEKEHTIEVARRADLDVLVEDAEGPVADANVVLRQDDEPVVSGRTNANGRFSSGAVEQGRYTLSVVKPGYYRTTENLIVAGSPEETVRIERGRVDYDVVVQDPHFDPPRPVADATVSAAGVTTATTGERGAVAPLLPVNSRLEVQVSKEGYGTVTETVSVNESSGSLVVSMSREPALSLTALNDRVVAGESVAVEVTNAYGEPAAGVALFVDGERVAETDADGEATLPIEEPGDHELQARRGGTTSAAVVVRGVGEGGATATETQEPTTTPTSSPATTAADGPASGLTGLVGPLVALVALGLVLVLGVVYWRRNRDDEWTEGESVGTVDPHASDAPAAGDPGVDASGTGTGTAADEPPERADDGAAGGRGDDAGRDDGSAAGHADIDPSPDVDSSLDVDDGDTRSGVDPSPDVGDEGTETGDEGDADGRETGDEGDADGSDTGDETDGR
jgi:hypothetical protein